MDRCVSWTKVSGRERSRLGSGTWSWASVDLPTDADGLYLISRGARASGTLYVSESRAAEDVSVKVFVNHAGPETHASVCQLSQDGRQMGVGIFAPSNWHMIPWLGRGSNLRFVVEVELPPSHGAVRYLPSFRADLPMFTFALDDLSAFHFGNLALESSNSAINVEGVIANSVEVHTTNGGIRGAFNTSDDLTLVTTNMPISVRVGAANGGSKKPTDVLMRTTNAHIEADISLKSKSSSGTGGSFGVHAHATNGFIKIVYEDSPVGSVLNSDIRSTNAPVHVALHRAYEGTFSLRTTNSPASLDQLRHVEDPSGRGRERVLSSRSTNGHVVYGQVEWSPSSRDSRAGSVDVSTTNGFAQLSL
ncbi:hypothetical protein BC827DRAFT_1126128 [Russula dissimulans]|nr:hypothetical protein BC827DRAFT_1126128 [Russula dissimulans]